MVKLNEIFTFDEKKELFDKIVHSGLSNDAKALFQSLEIKTVAFTYKPYECFSPDQVELITDKLEEFLVITDKYFSKTSQTYQIVVYMLNYFK